MNNRYVNTRTGAVIESEFTPEQAAEVCAAEGGAFAQHWAAQYHARVLSRNQLFQLISCAEQIEGSRENA